MWSGNTVACLLVAALLAGCSVGGTAATTTPTPSPLSPSDYCAGTNRGQLVVYSAKGLEYWYSEILSNFEVNCGLKIFYLDGTSPQVLGRLQGEARAPLADIFIAQPPYIATAATANLLEPSQIATENQVPADRCDRQLRWCDVAENYASWTYNSGVTPSPPRTWDDLLGPDFANHVLYSRPDDAVDGLVLLEELVATMGRDQALAYLRRLETVTDAHYGNTDTMSHLVFNRTDLVAAGDLQEHLNDIGQYEGLGIFFPAANGEVPMTIAVPYAAGLVHGGHNRANAEALLRYMWAAQSQGEVGRAFVAPARTDVRPTDSRSQQVQAELKKVHVSTVDWEAASADQAALVASWLSFRSARDAVGPAPASPLPPPSAHP